MMLEISLVLEKPPFLEKKSKIVFKDDLECSVSQFQRSLLYEGKCLSAQLIG